MHAQRDNALATAQALADDRAGIAIASDCDGRQFDRLIGGDHPDRSAIALLEDRGQRQGQGLGGRALEAHVGGHAQGGPLVGVDDGNLRCVGARRRISRWRQFANATVIGPVTGPERDTGRVADPHGGALLLWQRDLHLALAVESKAIDRLAGGQNLSGFRQHRGDDTAPIGRQRCVGALVGGESRLGLRRFQGGFLGVECGRTDEVLGLEIAIALGIGISEDELGVCLIGLEGNVGGIEAGEDLAGDDVRAKVRLALEQLATNAEADRQLVARMHVATVATARGGLGRAGNHGPDSDRASRRWRGRGACRQSKRGQHWQCGS